MNTRVDKKQENKYQSVPNETSQRQKCGSTSQFVDNRPEANAQRMFQETANNSPQVNQLKAFEGIGVVQRDLYHYNGAPFTEAEAGEWNRLVGIANDFAGTKAFIEGVETDVYDFTSGVTVAGSIPGLRALIGAGILSRRIDRNDADDLGWGEFAPKLREMAEVYGNRTGPVSTGGHAAQTYTYTVDGQSVSIAEETDAHGKTAGNLNTRRGQMKNAIDLYNQAVDAHANQYL